MEIGALSEKIKKQIGIIITKGLSGKDPSGLQTGIYFGSKRDAILNTLLKIKLKLRNVWRIFIDLNKSLALNYNN